MVPQDPKTNSKIFSSTNANSLKAAIFNTMAFKMSLEINNDEVTIPTKISFLKVFYNICKIKKKNINFEQYARIHLDGPKVLICETAWNRVSELNSSFTVKDQYFRVAIDEACEAFNKTMLDIGYTQNIELYAPQTQQVHPPQSHPFY